MHKSSLKIVTLNRNNVMQCKTMWKKCEYKEIGRKINRKQQQQQQTNKSV